MSARPSGTISTAVSAPIRLPNRARAIVVTLSTLAHEVSRSPFSGLGSMFGRTKPASIPKVVSGQMVIDAVSSKLSSCTITTGRGLPA